MIISKKKFDQKIRDAQSEVRQEYYKEEQTRSIWKAIDDRRIESTKIKKTIAGLDRRIEALEEVAKGGKK